MLSGFELLMHHQDVVLIAYSAKPDTRTTLIWLLQCIKAQVQQHDSLMLVCGHVPHMYGALTRFMCQEHKFFRAVKPQAKCTSNSSQAAFHAPSDCKENTELFMEAS